MNGILLSGDCSTAEACTERSRLISKQRRCLTLLALLVVTAIGSRSAAAQEHQAAAVLPPPSFEVPPLPASQEGLPQYAFPPESSGAVPGAYQVVATPTVTSVPMAPVAASGGSQLPPLVITPTPSWYHPAYWFGPDPWEGHVELGLNGSQGNNDVLSMRAGGHLQRDTDLWKIDSDIQYNKNVANSVETQNDAKLDFRVDRKLGDTPWTLFFLNNVIYDEFQAFDLQLSLNAGLGYQLIDTEVIDLLTRFGAGTTREFGGPDDEWKANALFGIDYEHRLTATQRLTAKVDYYPEFEDFTNYRVVTDAGWEIDLDAPKNVSLKFSVVDRYDSTPNGVDPNNFDYAMLLIWGL